MAYRALLLSFVLILASNVSGLCQCMQAPYPASCYQPKPCVVRPSPPPMVRTVQINVPAPCLLPTCGMPRRCPPHPCAPPVCAPPCPTRPVNVRVEVRVRPEPCGKGGPGRRGCRDLGPLRPLLGFVSATLAVPIRVLESFCPPSPPCRPPMRVCGPPPGCPPPHCLRPASISCAAPYPPPYQCKPRKVRACRPLTYPPALCPFPTQASGNWGRGGAQ
jgi:hypothetical protein